MRQTLPGERIHHCLHQLARNPWWWHWSFLPLPKRSNHPGWGRSGENCSSHGGRSGRGGAYHRLGRWLWMLIFSFFSSSRAGPAPSPSSQPSGQYNSRLKVRWEAERRRGGKRPTWPRNSQVWTGVKSNWFRSCKKTQISTSARFGLKIAKTYKSSKRPIYHNTAQCI